MASTNNLPTSSSGLMDVNQLIRQLFEPIGGFNYTGLEKGTGGSLTKMLTTNWIPNVDVKNETNLYTIHVDVPGVTNQNIEVSVANGNTLIIKGRKETQTEKKSNNYVRVERASGSFCRSVTLPSAVNASKIHAKVKNGVLEITAPKLTGKNAAKKIKVTAER